MRLTNEHKKQVLQQRQQRGLIRYLLHSLVEAVVMSAEEAAKVNEDDSNFQEDPKEVIRELYLGLMKLAAVSNQLVLVIKQFSLRETLNQLP